MPIRNIVLYDSLLPYGGAESVTFDLSETLGSCDICADFDLFEGQRKSSRVLTLGNPVTHRVLRYLQALSHFTTRTAFLKEYDLAMFSGSAALAAVANHPEGPNVVYCHTPPRFAYDLQGESLAAIPAWQRPVAAAFLAYVRRRYESSIRKMDLIFVNSGNVQHRLRQYIGLDATVVYPPCDVERFRWLGQDDYYLSGARLEPLKRVDVVIEAFKSMPDKKLIVASGGTEEAALKKLADGASNITFSGWSSDQELATLVGRSIAVIYVPVDEDFGMSAVEAMAAGKPVIGVAEGGLRETVVDGQTGKLTPADPGPEDLINAVQAVTPSAALEMRTACEQRARRFSRERFRQDISQLLSL